MRVAAAVFAGVLASSQAFAQSDDSYPTRSRPALVAAQVHYERSREQYATGRYHAAAQSLERALTLDPAGTTLWFNLGVVYERMGRLDLAVTAYTRYVRNVDNAEERARVDRILTRLRGAQEEFAQVRAGSRGRADAAFWLTLAGSLVCVAIGGTYLVASPNGSPAVGVGFLGGGGVLAGVAITLYAVRRSNPYGSVYISTSLSPTRPGLGLTMTF